MMKDIFVTPNGNMLENWKQAFPVAYVTSSLKTVPANEPVVSWVDANVDNKIWLDGIMAELASRFLVAKIVVLANTPTQVDAFAVMAKGIVGYCHAYSNAKTLQEIKTSSCMVVYGLGRIC